MAKLGTFPFGQSLCMLKQQDRRPKKIFVLGVYASAVHARWISPEGKIVSKALAVASEPCIFWRGEEADSIIGRIEIPKRLGKLIPAHKQFNGPSGIALDDMFLKPLGVCREDAWLCDLVPHSCVNISQQKAIDRAYLPIMKDFNLPIPSIPTVPSSLSDGARRTAIVNELRESQAQTLILLGDQPIRWFLKSFDQKWSRLSDFGTDSSAYGKLHKVDIAGIPINVLPLAHPRQVARLGRSSKAWYELHQEWIKRILQSDGK
jgi:uracil-DNA glycosylase